MKYIIKSYFSKVECDSIINFCMKNGEQFSYYEKEINSWDCRRIYDDEFKKYILNRILDVQNFDSFVVKNINISLTRYYDSRRLDLHLDSTSNYTTVISLTDGYDDGRFVISDKFVDLNSADVKIPLKLGEGVTFEGNKLFHGVMPVHTGLRCALNIWMNDSDFSYYKLDKNKKLL